MKKNTKDKLKFFSILLTGSIVFNTFSPSFVNAIEFNPSGSTGDDETNKEYTAELEQIQINTLMPLNLIDETDDDYYGMGDDESEQNDLTLEGTVRINKKLDNGNVEYLNELPEVNLVDENNNIVATTDILCESEFTSNPSDLYYITLYDLNIENKKAYRLVTTFKDNDNNEITKYITYSGKLMISEGVDAKLQYMSVNNILNLIFECENGKIEGNNTTINGIDIDIKKEVAQNCLDSFMNEYNSVYKQKDFDLAINNLENNVKAHINSFMSNQEDKDSYICEFTYTSIHSLQVDMYYLLDKDSGMRISLINQNVDITYTNDNYSISSIVNNQINEIIDNISYGVSLEFELNNNYENAINSYDYITNVLNITNDNIFVKKLPSSLIAGVLNKFVILRLALGADDYVYNEDSGLMIEVKPVISIPKKYNSNQEKLDYATSIIQNYTKNNIDTSFEIESIKFSDEEEDVLDVRLTQKSSTGTFSITDSVRLKSVDYIRGDLDKNGIVNANDAAIALDLYKYGNVSKEELKIGDMDNNGIINANDAALILDIYKYGN